MKWLTASLRVKFFIMTFVLAFATIVTMSILQSRVLTQLLESSFRSSSIETSEKIGGEVDGIIQRWALSTVYLLQGIYPLQEAQAKEELQRLIDVEKDFTASDVFLEENKAFKLVNSYAKVEDKGSEKRSALAQSWLEKVRKADPDRLFFVDISPRKDVLRMGRGIPINIAEGKLFWIVVEASKNPILAQLNLQEGMKTTILTESMQDFMAGKALPADMAKILKQRIAPFMKLELGSGFFGSFVDSKKIAWQGSYYRLPVSGLTLVLQQREDILFAPLKYQITQTAKWAALILLLAVLLSFFSAEALINRLEKVTHATESIARGDFSTKISVTGNDEIKQLGDSVNAMAAQLSTLVNHEKDMVRLEHELNVANEVQGSFIPQEYSQEGAMILASSYRSASECGGDFWGHYVIAPHTHMLLVGDATGHGLPAALVTAIAYATGHLCSKLPAATASDFITPAMVLSLLNQALYDSLKGKLCMTFFACIIDTKNNTMAYSNGGHPFPLIIPQNPEDLRLKSGKRKAKPYIVLNDIKKNGAPLGFDPNSVYQNSDQVFMPGDRMVMYTDGIVECFNPEQKQWGMRNLEKSVQKNMTLSPIMFRDKIMSDMEEFRNNTPLPDDATLVVISSDFEVAA
ncbi:MAG: HAMP domain-containing protein [Proteobacteria bacterium]|nr:MAG: HAMP domain-containing protein [Pseudomonadota bacterium]